MPTPSTEPKSRITARVPQHVQTMLEDAAAFVGIPVNSFVVSAAVEKAGSILETERVIKLGRQDAEFLEQMIENPPQPNAALLAAVAQSERTICE